MTKRAIQIHPEEMVKQFTKTCVSLFVVAVFKIASNSKQPNDYQKENGETNHTIIIQWKTSQQ